MWKGLFVVDCNHGSFAFRIGKEEEGDAKEVADPEYPEFLKADQGITLALFRPDGKGRIARALQQHEYSQRVKASSVPPLANITYAGAVPGGEETFLRGHAYITTEYVGGGGVAEGVRGSVGLVGSEEGGGSAEVGLSPVAVGSKETSVTSSLTIPTGSSSISSPSTVPSSFSTTSSHAKPPTSSPSSMTILRLELQSGRLLLLPSPSESQELKEYQERGAGGEGASTGTMFGAVVPVPCGSWYHPVYHAPDSMSLPHNMADALDLLNQMPDSSPGIVKLKEIVAAHSHLLERGGSDDTPLEPFIVVEGMDATGKSTLVQNLCKHLGAIELCSPPPVMAAIRPHFDSKYPPLVRRTYYTLGNYLLGLQVASMRREKPVVMDRYWHSTAAYAIASECLHGDPSVLPPPGHRLYQWPSDLHCPGAVVLLAVDEGTRMERLRGRRRETAIKTTAEEKWLGQDENLRNRIATSYRRMGGQCRVVEVDASGTKEEVLQRTIDVLTREKII